MTERPYWLAAGTAGWGAIVLWKAHELPQFDQYAHIGPGLMPTAVGAGLVLLGLILALQIRRGVPFEEQGAEDVNDNHVVSHKALTLAAAACALPLLTMKPLGFVVTCTGCFVLVAAAFKSRRWGLNLALGAVVSLVTWWLFGKLGVQLGGLLPALGV
ncbi:tripartite tricarboxylate transporter TctB family protein [Rhodobacter sp. Har01]|uniref:tripartite tricarboxylate transporter TctB family protein n=1 Tax=Rhodobacter sp. Har01 TaxID=2883999 RepID=UPI001D081E51|nr:tripartite tricarboxylate transporter TctB family protein [Rhodobacter sp. Har01]MCB6178123.1 tripartite tricarboxylate transporter TctB family protein [Rhodobacter sp. Har01]